MPEEVKTIVLGATPRPSLKRTGCEMSSMFSPRGNNVFPVLKNGDFHYRRATFRPEQ